MIIQQRLDIQVVCSKDNLKQHFLINGDELLVPFANIRCAFACLVLTCFRVSRRKRLSTMMLAILENLKGACKLMVLDIVEQRRTFFSTLEETLGKGIGWSDSPTSRSLKRCEFEKSLSGIE